MTHGNSRHIDAGIELKVRRPLVKLTPVLERRGNSKGIVISISYDDVNLRDVIFLLMKSSSQTVSFGIRAQLWGSSKSLTTMK